ncbi:MAG: 16S rRNA (cytosine(1402)-N(4))-methyltransferase RsmH, partial [Acidimicrobiales bacterium]|nr:16S rRNA (cytosine(1402)-N(4))-methyltransferase RsmH [Acidimicrobiales bacterium]
MSEFAHAPVMVDEVVALFGPVPAGVLVDATVGGGGHAEALLRTHDHLSLLGLDRDEDALAASSARLAPFGDRVTLRHTRFDHLAESVHGIGVEEVSGVLCDLGVSSPQLDRPERGFSYRSDAPLDMRMDRTQARTAADIVNTWSEDALADLLRDAGGERYARPIARALVAARPVERTDELAEIVRSAIPAPARRRGGDPARRSFQALRIAVNDEL